MVRQLLERDPHVLMRMQRCVLTAGTVIPCCSQNKEHVASAVKEELTKAMTGFGYEIIQARLRCLRRPAKSSRSCSSLSKVLPEVALNP